MRCICEGTHAEGLPFLGVNLIKGSSYSPLLIIAMEIVEPYWACLQADCIKQGAETLLDHTMEAAWTLNILKLATLLKNSAFCSSKQNPCLQRMHPKDLRILKSSMPAKEGLNSDAHTQGAQAGQLRLLGLRRDDIRL